MNKICFQLFHIDGVSDKRDILAKRVLDKLSPVYENLNSPTIKMSNKEDYDLFVKSNSILNIHEAGYSYLKEVGWRFGELGLWASNLLSYKNFLKTNNDILMLIEDDIILNKDFIDHLEESIKNLPQDWEVFHFFNPNNKSVSQIANKNDIEEPFQTWSTLCYLVNKKSAQKILDHIEKNPIDKPLDWFFFQQKELFKQYTLSAKAKMSCKIVEQETSTIQLNKRNHIDDTKKKILYVVHRYAPYPGGSENYVKDMAQETLNRGHNVWVLAGENQGNYNGVSVTDNQKIAEGVWDLIIVHGAERYQQHIMQIIAQTKKSPFLFLPIEAKYYTANQMNLGLKHSKYIGYSTKDEREALKVYKVGDKIIHVGHGVNEKECIGNPGFKEKYGIKTSKMFLSSGGFWAHKNMQNLVDIFERANPEDTTLVLTGYNTKDHAENINFTSENIRVMVLPNRQEVLNAMHESDLFILNSYKEGFGIVLLEATLNDTQWASRNTPGATDMAEFGFVYEEDQQLEDYIKKFKPSKNEKAYKEVMSNRLVKYTVDKILSILE